MSADQPYTEADVELVAVATEQHHIPLTSQTNADGHCPCVCGRWWDSADGPSWDEHMAEVMLAALAAAGRLLPADAQVDTEYAFRHVTTGRITQTLRSGDDGEADDWETVVRDVIRTPRRPWVSSKNTEEPGCCPPGFCAGADDCRREYDSDGDPIRTEPMPGISAVPSSTEEGR